MFVDTHAHLYNEYYDDIYDIITSSYEQSVKYIINSGIDRKTNNELLNQALSYKDVYITLGIHPESVNNYLEEDLIHIKENLQNPKVVAIGEIGLDYHYEGYDRKKQIELFEKQLSIAEKYNMPVVIHSREATQDTLDILKRYSLKGVIHSFSGSKEIAREYIKLGYKLGINGVVTFKNAHIIDVIKELGLSHFVLETDSPYLTPAPYRGQKNYPGNISIIVNFLKEQLALTEEEISKITSNNVISIFDKIVL